MATYRAADTSPKEQFVYHNAGLGGYGGSSAIDGVILRDKDADTAWSAASDGTLEERVYYCQNWRGDVSVVIEDDADMVEWVKYSAYGVPFGLPLGDVDSDGDLDTTDAIAIATWGGGYDVRADLNLDGVIDVTDIQLVGAAVPITLGWGNLSDRGNRKGYGGYELDPVLSYTTWHVRFRVLLSDLGRWITRDPIEYADGMNLYQYVSSDPVLSVDPFGLLPPPGGGELTGGFGRRPTPPAIYPPGYGLAPELAGLGKWIKKRLACWRCVRDLDKLYKAKKCNRKRMEEDCYNKKPYDAMERNLCLINVLKQLHKCMQGLADALPNCIKCAYIVPKPTR